MGESLYLDASPWVGLRVGVIAYQTGTVRRLRAVRRGNSRPYVLCRVDTDPSLGLAQPVGEGGALRQRQRERPLRQGATDTSLNRLK